MNTKITRALSAVALLGGMMLAARPASAGIRIDLGSLLGRLLGGDGSGGGCSGGTCGGYSDPAAALNVPTLRAGQRIDGLWGRGGTVQVIRILVPSGARALELRTGGGAGEADLYLSYGRVPTGNAWQFRSVAPGNYEGIAVRDPAAGAWYLAIHARGAYSGLTLLTACGGGAEEDRAIVLRSPTGGELWRIGYTYTVRWAASRNVRRVQLQISTDDGATWRLLSGAAAVDADDGRYTFTLPRDRSFISDRVHVRIVDIDRPGNVVVCDRFAIGNEGRDRYRDRDGRHGQNWPQGQTPAPLPDVRTIPTLSNGQTLAGLAGCGERLFRIYVPAGTRQLVISAGGGQGQYDVYAAYNARPGAGSGFVLRGGQGRMNITNPRAGWWYISLQGCGQYQQVQLMVAWR